MTSERIRQLYPTPPEFSAHELALIDAIANAVWARMQASQGPALPEMLSIDETMALLGCKRHALDVLRQSGRLIAVQHGSRPRFRREDVERVRDEGW